MSEVIKSKIQKEIDYFLGENKFNSIDKLSQEELDRYYFFIIMVVETINFYPKNKKKDRDQKKSFYAALSLTYPFILQRIILFNMIKNYSA